MPFSIFLKDETVDLEISSCEDCHFIFQSSSYTGDYERLAHDLYENYKIADQYDFPQRSEEILSSRDFIRSYIKDNIDFSVIEIGSNRGDFLYLLKEKFQKINVLGIEPTRFCGLSIPTINAYYTPDLVSNQFDMIIMRHTLEHIKDPAGFINDVKKLLSSDGMVFIEVPNTLKSLRDGTDDFTPDHVNYFTPESLSRVMKGMNIEKISDEKHLQMIFSKSGKSRAGIKPCVDSDSLFHEFKLKQENLVKLMLTYERVVFYGMGNFYLWLYSRLKDFLSEKTVLVFDDFIDSDPYYGISYLDGFKKGDIVVLCSSNEYIQDKMASGIPSGIAVLYPWKKLDKE